MTDEQSGWFSDDAATFGDRLAAARERARLSQAQLADRLGVKTATLVAWEEDRKEPRANRLSMLAGMLGISLTWLMTGQGDGPDGPLDTEAASADLLALLGELRVVRSELAHSTERLARLEKQLRSAIGESA